MQDISDTTYKFAVPIQIKMCDLDPFAHVNNGVQCNYFDYGRSRYFESVFGEKIDWLSMDMVLVHTELDFKSPIKVHDDIVCETAIYHIGNKSISMIQQLRSREEGSVKTICKSVLSGFDRTTESSAPIQEKYKEAIRNFEKL